MGTMQYKFVESIPEKLENGVLYVSIPFSTVIHLCACGCGNEVVTPLSPKDWELVFNGETVSLYPSIGNWNLPCRSHYWIKKNKIKWALEWSNEMIDKATKKDRKAKHKFFNKKK